MGYVIDTSILIAAERGRIDLRRRVHGREDAGFFLSVISASELLHGVTRAADAAVRARRSAFVEEVLHKFPILTIDLATARVHARLWAELAGRGAMIGAHDAWIAAGALAHGHTIATANMREFDRVPGLTTENWSEKIQESF